MASPEETNWREVLDRLTVNQYTIRDSSARIEAEQANRKQAEIEIVRDNALLLGLDPKSPFAAYAPRIRLFSLVAGFNPSLIALEVKADYDFVIETGFAKDRYMKQPSEDAAYEEHYYYALHLLGAMPSTPEFMPPLWYPFHEHISQAAEMAAKAGDETLAFVYRLVKEVLSDDFRSDVHAKWKALHPEE